MTDDLRSALERLERVEREVAHMRDTSAIRDVLTRYSRALDWLDDELLSDVFFDDAEIDYGFFKGNGRDFKPFLMQFERGVGRRWHSAGQVKIAVRDATAEVESYAFAFAAEQVSPPAHAHVMHFYGKYFDRFIKRDGRWAIIRRRYLQISAAAIEEAPMDGALSQLNSIGAATPAHPDYRSLIDSDGP